MITIIYDSGGKQKELQYKKFHFNAGEIQVRLLPTEPILEKELTFKAYLYNADDIMTLFLLADAVLRLGQNNPIRLIIPYMPYSRQDRVCANGEAFALNVFYQHLFQYNWKSIETWDVHSKVALEYAGKRNIIYNRPGGCLEVVFENSKMMRHQTLDDIQTRLHGRPLVDFL